MQDAHPGVLGGHKGHTAKSCCPLRLILLICLRQSFSVLLRINIIHTCPIHKESKLKLKRYHCILVYKFVLYITYTYVLENECIFKTFVSSKSNHYVATPLANAQLIYMSSS